MSSMWNSVSVDEERVVVGGDDGGAALVVRHRRADDGRVLVIEREVVVELHPDAPGEAGRASHRVGGEEEHPAVEAEPAAQPHAVLHARARGAPARRRGGRARLLRARREPARAEARRGSASIVPGERVVRRSWSTLPGMATRDGGGARRGGRARRRPRGRPGAGTASVAARAPPRSSC